MEPLSSRTDRPSVPSSMRARPRKRRRSFDELIPGLAVLFIILCLIAGLIRHKGAAITPTSPKLTDFSLNSISMVSSEEGWAVGEEGVIMHYQSGAWERAQSPTSESLSRVTFVSASEGWAIGDHGTILHYLNGIWS